MSVRALLDTLSSSGQSALVVGLGASGVESAKLLAHRGLKVLLAEREPEASFLQKPKMAAMASTLRSISVDVCFGVDGENVAPYLADVGLVILSPGVSLESAVVGTIIRLKVPYITELELRVGLHDGKSVVVTGSNGKSTTAALVCQMLRCAGFAPAGAVPCSSEPSCQNNLPSPSTSAPSVLVMTASSYQLEACTVLKPNVSVVLNLSENHLERHGSLERYAAAKSRCLQLQDGSDVAVLNADSPSALNMSRSTRASISLCGRKPLEELLERAKNAASISTDASVAEGGCITASIAGHSEVYALNECALFGAHNRSNLAAAILAARSLGAPQAAVQQAISTFAPLEHRLEVVSRDSARVVVNDSKSTTVASSLAALSAVRSQFPEHRVVLMIGGLSKAGSWDPLLREVASSAPMIEPLICFGKDGPLLASHCRAGKVSCAVATTLREATARALQTLHGIKRGVVLLSPGCGSFDEFKDYEHRGEAFKSYLQESDSSSLNCYS